MEVKSNEKAFTMPMPSLSDFTSWILSHTKPMASSLHVTGTNADSTKTIRADFVLSEFPFKHKDAGVDAIRTTLAKIHAAHVKDKIGMATTLGADANMVYLPREMEVTLVYETALTSDATKHLDEFKKSHRRLTIVELSLHDHLRAYLLDHCRMPRSLRRLNKAETKAVTPKGDLVMNELREDAVEVQLIGGVPGDVIESVMALKTGVNMPPQYWKIIAKPKKKK